jgi:hypothetical protein
MSSQSLSFGEKQLRNFHCSMDAFLPPSFKTKDQLKALCESIFKFTYFSLEIDP